MDATANFNLRFARLSESKVEKTDWVLSRQVLQRSATRMSLLGEAMGFLVLGILIIVNRHQAELNGLSGDSSVAIVGGISTVLVGSIFFLAAGLHWRFCARHPATLPVRRQPARFTFAWPQAATAITLLSA